MHTTLLVMAAGMGSRYGGNKQVDRLGPNGEILLQYGVYDAARAGFDKVVFVIRKSMADSFPGLIGDRPYGMQTAYACQEFENLPAGFLPPDGRVKPYGTVHAMLSAKDLIHEPFAVINADDYYGPEAFAEMAGSLRRMAGEPFAASMVAYRLANTLSDSGTVTRGVCSSKDGCLTGVKETYQIGYSPDGSIRDFSDGASGQPLDPEAPVSMNFWGFTPSVMQAGEEAFKAFLRDRAPLDPLKSEFVLPTLVDLLMRRDGLRVEMLHSPAVWFGVTYKEDRQRVMDALKHLHETGVYPEKL